MSFGFIFGFIISPIALFIIYLIATSKVEHASIDMNIVGKKISYYVTNQDEKKNTVDNYIINSNYKEK